MLQILRHGISISRHHHKGVYVWQESTNPTVEVICTARHGSEDYEREDSESSRMGSKHRPLLLSHRGQCTMFRPWDPYTCVIAAAIHKRLIQFPISPGRFVFALNCPMETLGHLAEIVSDSGDIIDVIDKSSARLPTPEDLKQFSKRRRVSIITEDIKNASYERYERLLSVPKASKYAFLMALHPRLGASSPARRLLDAESPCELVRTFFSFLECAPLEVECLFVSQTSPSATSVDAVRELVLKHIDVFHSWRALHGVPPTRDSTLAGTGAPAAQAAEGGGDDNDARKDKPNEVGGADGAKKSTNEQDSSSLPGKPAESGSADDAKTSKSEKDSSSLSVLLDLMSDHIITGDPTAVVTDKLSDLATAMKRTPDGLRTGLRTKELLTLAPYFPDRQLMLLKYTTVDDERYGGRRAPKKKAAQLAKLEESRKATESALRRVPVVEIGPPKVDSIPVPAFMPRAASQQSAPGPTTAKPARRPPGTPAPAAPAAQQVPGTRGHQALADPSPGQRSSSASCSAGFVPAPPGLELLPAGPAAAGQQGCLQLQALSRAARGSGPMMYDAGDGAWASGTQFGYPPVVPYGHGGMDFAGGRLPPGSWGHGQGWATVVPLEQGQQGLRPSAGPFGTRQARGGGVMAAAAGWADQGPGQWGAPAGLGARRSEAGRGDPRFQPQYVTTEHAGEVLGL